MSKRCLINVDGGLGKNVMLTALMPIIKTKYDEIYVISPYFDVFKACSYVTDAFPPMQGTLYQELGLAEDCDILCAEPYNNRKFIKKQVHLFQAWLEEMQIEIPENFNPMELKPVLDKIPEEFPQIKQLVDTRIDEIKKFIIVQFCGGQSPLSPQLDNNGNPIGYNDHQEGIKRNYFKGQELINLLRKEYPDTAIIHYALPNEPSYEGTVKLELPYLGYHLMAEKAEKVVCTDSSLQHLSTGACNNVTVIWGETRPEHFGWNSNKNICAKNVLNSQPYFKPFGCSPSIVNFPKPEEVMKVINE